MGLRALPGPFLGEEERELRKRKGKEDHGEWGGGREAWGGGGHAEMGSEVWRAERGCGH